MYVYTVHGGQRTTAGVSPLFPPWRSHGWSSAHQASQASFPTEPSNHWPHHHCPSSLVLFFFFPSLVLNGVISTASFLWAQGLLAGSLLGERHPAEGFSGFLGTKVKAPAVTRCSQNIESAWLLWSRGQTTRHGLPHVGSDR